MQRSYIYDTQNDLKLEHHKKYILSVRQYKCQISSDLNQYHYCPHQWIRAIPAMVAYMTSTDNCALDASCCASTTAATPLCAACHVPLAVTLYEL
jgi:hypothetical protein